MRNILVQMRKIFDTRYDSGCGSLDSRTNNKIKSYSELETERREEIRNKYSELLNDGFFISIIGVLFTFGFVLATSNLYYVASFVFITAMTFIHFGYGTYADIEHVNKKYGERMRKDVDYEN